MTDSLKLAEMQRTSIEFERQRHLANWFIKSSPHMATPATPLSTNGGVNGSSTTNGAGGSNASHNTNSATQSGNVGTKMGNCVPACASGTTNTTTNPLFFLMSSNGNTGVGAGNTNGIAAGNSGGGKHVSANAGIGNSEVTVTSHTSRAHQVAPLVAAAHHIEGRKPKLRRFNSHDTGANMFSVADFENARLARRNEIEMKQRLQRRMKMSSSAQGACGYGANSSGYGISGGGCLGGYGSLGGDCSTGDSKGSKHSNDSQTEPLQAEIFLERYTLPRVVRISYKTKYAQETLQSSSSNGSSMATTSSSTQSSSGNGTGSGSGTGTTTSSTSSSGNINTTNSNTNTNQSNSNNNNSNSNINNISGQQQQINGSSSNSSKHGGNASNNATSGSGLDAQEKQGGELFLLYRLVRQRQIYHGFNAKTGVANRKKGVMIPQEFPGYFSLVNEKGLPTATQYTTLIQLVRERVYKFVSVDNMSAFTESQTNQNASAPPNDSCGQTGGIVYHANGPPVPPPPPANIRPQYVKTTARGGQVFRLLAVFEDGKQDHSCSTLTHKPHNSHGREKEKGRYAQLLNEQRQVLYVSLATKGKFYEIEPGIPQILQKLSNNCTAGALVAAEQQRKVNPDCVHRITALVPSHTKELPQTLRFISGPTGSSNSIPEQLSITKLTTETVVIACPIEDVEVQSPLHLRKLHLTADMQLVKCALGFESEQRMFANPNVQNILKFCQFNCDQFLRMVEVEVLNRPAGRSGSKNRGGDTALRILKPLHLPKLLRREKTTISAASAHEKEDSIIFLSKHDLASLEAKEQQQQQQSRQSESAGSSRISEKMKVFQTTKKKWFRRQDKHAVSSLTSLDLDVQAKRMSMERYNDMSKLLQERFGDKRASGTTQNGGGHGDECISERSSSEIGCSDTETTTLHSIPTIEEKLQKFGKTKALPLQKSQSLQDVELIGNGKPDLLRSHRANAADTISEAGTDIEDMENRPPSSNTGHEQPQSSFITEKLFSEFHVKTRQYSKSSSSLHQLIHFAEPQKLQISEQQNKWNSNSAQLKQQQGRSESSKKQLDFNIGEPVTGRRAAGGLSLIAAVANHSFSNSTTTTGNTSSSLLSPLTPTTISMLEDDLPYSSVRDSLVLSSDESGPEQQTTPGQICQALHLIDYAKENIYAEICHNGVTQLQSGRDYCGSAGDENEADDYGDYASLTPPYMSIGGSSAGTGVASSAAQAVSRVQINCSSSPVSYHTVYLRDEPLGEHYAVSKRQATARQGRSTTSATPDLTNVTTVECVPTTRMQGNSLGANEASAISSSHTRSNQRNSHQQHPHHNHLHSSQATSRNIEVAEQSAVDNIYNTLK